MASTGRRQERLADQIRKEVADIIAGELRDPRIGFATVTRVEVSADLQHARVLISVLGKADVQEETLAVLSSAAGYVRHELARRLRLRRTPDLVFVLDRGVEEGLRIEALLRELKREDSAS